MENKKTPPAAFNNEQEIDTYFFSTLSIIATNHDCTIEDIDMDKRIVNLSGPAQSQLACAIEIGNALEKFSY